MRPLFCLIAALAAVPAAAETPAPPSPFSGAITATGAEPFWALSIDPASKTMWLREMEGTGYPANDYVAPAIAPDGTATFTAKDFKVTLKATGACSDGMSDLVFPMEATVAAEGHTYRGCAYSRWDNDLLTLLPQIDACLAAAKTKGPVTLATRTNAGVIVRLLDDGDTFQCGFPGEATIPGTAAKLADAEPMIGEMDPLFFRAPGENPGGECFEAPEVRDAKGALIGWTMANEDC